MRSSDVLKPRTVRSPQPGDLRGRGVSATRLCPPGWPTPRPVSHGPRSEASGPISAPEPSRRSQISRSRWTNGIAARCRPADALATGGPKSLISVLTGSSASAYAAAVLPVAANLPNSHSSNRGLCGARRRAADRCTPQPGQQIQELLTSHAALLKPAARQHRHRPTGPGRPSKEPGICSTEAATTPNCMPAGSSP
jgi:hypothetical protein